MEGMEAEAEEEEEEVREEEEEGKGGFLSKNGQSISRGFVIDFVFERN